MTPRYRSHTIVPVAALGVALLPLAGGASASAAPGGHDTGFGGGGFAFSSFGLDRNGELLRDAAGVALVRQPKGQLVAAATVRTYGRGAGAARSTSIALFRVTSRGKPDRTFGRRGMVLTNLSGGSETATSLIRQPNGRLVLAGSAHGKMLLVRYTPSGRLDRSFGGDGSVVVSVGPGTDVATGLRSRAGGRVLAVGQSGSRAALVQLRSDGGLDKGFGHGGAVLLDLGPRTDRLSGLAIDRAGRIVASGTDGLTAVLVRLSVRGKIDRTFGTRGVASVPEATGHAVALDSAGRALLAGGDFAGGGVDSRGRPLRKGIVVARFTGGGQPDSGFGQAGVARFTDFPDATALLVDGSARPLVAGGAGGVCAFIARLSPAGTLDSTFGPPPTGAVPSFCPPNGLTSQVFEISVRGGDGGESAYSGLLLQPDRKIVAVGSMGGDEAGQGLEPVIARYEG